MATYTNSWAAGKGTISRANPQTPAETQPDVTQGKMTYGGFIFWLQRLGINPSSIRSNDFGLPIGRGRSFSVSRHRVGATNYRAMDLRVFSPKAPFWSREMPRINTYVAFKRIIVREEAAKIDVSDQGQLYAICREIQALIHPQLRDHESIVKLQSIIWENGFGAGSDSDLPMWPTLVLEYCETNLAVYQLNNKPLDTATKVLIGSKVGSGLGALHTAEIFHGDLKSENILIKIGPNGVPEPKVADFGCCIVLEKAKKTSRYFIGGTEMWCAPECPGYFTDVDAIAATDWYSFGLLLLRIDLDGRNPFEEMDLIPAEWTEDEKSAAIRCLKEDDCLYPLLCAAYVPGEFLATRPVSNNNHIACFLIADPIKRLEAMESYFLEIAALMPAYIEDVKSKNTGPTPNESLDLILSTLEQVQLDLDTVEDEEEEETDPFDLGSLFSSAQSTSFVPNISWVVAQMQVATIKREATLNSKTRTRLVDELISIMQESSPDVSSGPCTECCALSRIDTEPHLLSPESLIDEIKRILSKFSEGIHSCQKMISTLSPEELNRSQSLYGGSVSLYTYRRSQAAYQLFLAYIAGYGTEKDDLRALEVLEEVVTTGIQGCCVYLCQYAQFMGLELPSNLPIRKWLTHAIFFMFGIPSGAFRALSKLDSRFAETVRAARSKLYNGSSSTFGGMQFNGIHVLDNGELEIPKRYLEPNGAFDDMYENTLLHLAAGSEGSDTMILSFCVTRLGIDVDVRNTDGVTPLLMACRAGRDTKILALLNLGANVALNYSAGETPLHWLGLLPDPGPVLEQFLARGANINANVTHGRAIPNFSRDSRAFYQPGSPLMWAIAMDSEAYVKALIANGADVSHPNPHGLTPISFACMPQHHRFLQLLSTASSFLVTNSNAYHVLKDWNEMQMLASCRTWKQQDECLSLIINKAKPFLNMDAVREFYIYLIPKAVSDARVEIVEILLLGLMNSMATVEDKDAVAYEFARKPLAHPIWVDRHLAHLAAERGDPKVLHTVLNYGGDATSLDGFERSTLYMVSSSSNNPDCIDVLISHGALALLNHRCQLDGMTAFANAVANCNFLVADRLLEYTSLEDRQAILSSKSFREKPSWSQSLFGHFIAYSSLHGPKPLEYLLAMPEVNQNPDLLFIVDDEYQRTALMLASGVTSEANIYDEEIFATTRRKSSMQLLLKHYSEPRHINQKDSSGATALHLAAWTGNSDVVTALLDAGAAINPEDRAGRTPLDAAFLTAPDYLRHESESKGFIITIFEKNRNYICEELRGKGGKHNVPESIPDSWDDHQPFPWLHEKRAQAIAMANQKTTL